MFKKKYFVLTAVLLVGVVLLSGCLGGGSDVTNNETEETIENAKVEQVIKETFTALENQDETQFNSLVSNETTYYFKGELLNNESSKTLSSQEIYADLLSYYEGHIISDIQIDELNIENNSATAIVKVTTDKYVETLPMQINVEISNEDSLITKFGYIDKVTITEELKIIEDLIAAIENNDKNSFIEELESGTTFIYNDNQVIANNPTDFYDDNVNQIESINSLDKNLKNTIFENNSTNTIIFDVSNSNINYTIEVKFGKDIQVESINYYENI